MPMPRRIIQSNISFSHAYAAPNEITDNTSRSSQNKAPLPPRLVAPMTRTSSPPRVHTRSRNLSPRNFSQDAFCGMDTAHMTIALGNHHWSQQHQSNAVVHPVTGKEMEYMALMKDLRLQPLWKQGFGNEYGRLFQGIRYIPGTDTCLFIKLTNIPKAERSLTAK
jgi:hypothetical protein